jgi:3-hydroxyisobutyrate dehydrogenase-like beta-hydroxyacid dehydrogenase
VSVGERIRIGFIGLGAMGGPMAERLVDTDHDLVVFDRDQGRVQALVGRGASAGESPAHLATLCEEIHTCLPSEDAVREVLLDPESGVLAAAAPGLLVVEHSTVSVELSVEVGARADQAGAEAIDAPVSTGGGSARDGALTIMVGGRSESYERALPVLESLGRTIVHFGPAGAGTVAKLATQYMGVCNLVVAMEGLLMAQAHGADIDKLGELAPGTPAASAVLAHAVQWITTHDVGTPGGFRGVVSIFAKDITLGVGAAQSGGSPHVVGDLAAGLFNQAVANGMGEARWTSALGGLERLPESARDATE